MAFFICAALLFAFCVYIGFLIGNTLGERAVTRAEYWKMNGAAVAIAIVLTVFVASLPLLYSAVVGLLAGSLVGLKMAFGESVGPWRAHDKMFNVNRGHRDAAASGSGEARRRRRRDGGPAPDLISVQDGQDGSTQDAKDER